MEELNYTSIDRLPHEIIAGFADRQAVSPGVQKLIDELINTHEQGVYSVILYKLTRIKFTPAKAKNLWEVLLNHRERLNRFLRRDVGIFVAAMDYLANYGERYIRSPLILDGNDLQEMKNSMLTDEATGLYNLACYEKRIRQETALSGRTGTPLSLLLLRVRDREDLPENSASRTGNGFSKEVSDLILGAVRASDTVFYTRPGEFVLLLPGTLKKGALILGRKIEGLLKGLLIAHKALLETGVAAFPEDTKKDGHLLLALAKASMAGKNAAGRDERSPYPDEKRKSKRIPFSGENGLLVKWLHPAGLNSRIHAWDNISKQGIGFRVKEKTLDASDRVIGHITNKDQEIRFRGEVVWTRKTEDDSYAVGVRFLAV